MTGFPTKARRGILAGFGPWALLVLLLSLSALTVMNYLVHQQMRTSNQTERQLAQNGQLLVELHSLVLNTAMMTAASRGYALTGSAEFVAPFETSLRQGERNLGRTLAKLPSGWEQRPDVVELAALYNQRLEWSKSLAPLIAKRDPDAVAAKIRTLAGERMLARIDSLVGDLERDASQHRRNLIATGADSRQQAQYLVIALSVLVTLLLIAAAISAIRALKSRQRALERAVEARDRFQSIFDNASDGIILFNDRNRIDAVNRAAEAMFGKTAKDMLGARAGLLLSDQDEVEKLRKLVVAQKRNWSTIRRLTAVRANGDLFDTELSLTTFTDGPDHQRHYLAVLRDVTERERLERMKNEFISTVSHELRTPLTSIAGSLGLLEGGAAGELNEGGQRLVSIARNNCGRLIRLINDILDVDKLEAGKLRFNLRRLGLRAIVERAVEELRPYASQKHVHYTTSVIPMRAAVMADEDRLLQILTNLISNATKFSPPGGEVRMIVTQPDRKYWRISVVDRGPGIPIEMQSHIFDKFVQADSSATREQGGTGLGLTIAKQLTEGMGGRISFISDPGRETAFHLDLERARELRDAKDNDAVALPEQRYVLHVDDDEDTLNIVAAGFTGKSLVTSCSSLAAARNALRSRRFEAAIIDVDLPDGKGLEIIPELKERNPHIKIIAFTAYDPDFDHQGMADLVVTKSKGDLDKLITQVLHTVEPEAAAINVVASGNRSWQYKGGQPSRDT